MINESSKYLKGYIGRQKRYSSVYMKTKKRNFAYKTHTDVYT